MDLGPGPYKYRVPLIQSAFRLWISTLAQDSRTSALSSGLSTQHTGLDSAQLQDSGSSTWDGASAADSARSAKSGALGVRSLKSCQWSAMSQQQQQHTPAAPAATAHTSAHSGFAPAQPRETIHRTGRH
jgi:hypothetical protein